MAAPKLIDVNYDGPQRIDRYNLVAEIASGGMATVFLASLSGVGGFRRFVAIKRLHPHLAKEQEFVEMFLDEARLAAGIHHPHVVPILEVGASERGYYLVMEYIEGDTLARLLARAATSGQRLPPGIGVRILVDMLTGLHAAHELRDEQGEPTELVHRDVSPQNVLVGLDGNSRITDFGVARAASRLSATRAGQLKGKIAYMAPEQAVGDPTVDRRADVFSSGIVLWEVLAARRLFKAENEAATLSRVISEPIPDVREANPEIDDGVAAVVMKSLERDRDARYATCQEFADDLEKAAMACGSISTSRDVAAYVSNVIGQDIAQQREAVRTWMARSEVSRANSDLAEVSSASVPGQVLSVPGGNEPSHSGLMPASIAAPLGAPLIETGGRSRAPLIIGAAALLGFVVVAVLVIFMGRKTDQPAPASAAQVPAAAPAPSPATPAAPVATAAAEPAAVTAAAPATAAHAATVPSEEPGAASTGHTGHAGKWTRTSKAQSAPASPAGAPAPPASPKAAPAGGGDIDLSSPYR